MLPPLCSALLRYFSLLSPLTGGRGIAAKVPSSLPDTLSAGEYQRRWDAPQCLRAEGGTVVILRPWEVLADSPWRGRQPLRAGESCLLPAGSYGLSIPAGARLTLQPQPSLPPPSSGQGGWGAWLRRWQAR